MRGCILFKRVDLLIILLSQVLERDPENVKAFYRLGQAHLNQGEYEEGITAINNGLEVTYISPLPGFFSLLFTLHLTYYIAWFPGRPRGHKPQVYVGVTDEEAGRV